ncbi:Dynein light chain Tctex-type 1 [Trichinella pseudospiralis]|uniref:Dynein light chain Tctex-type 1 n=1 Tax=Trichinella pseudospiralis TaxID=6337 RepID=A0A0V0XQY1_TRIPS|nr:Dynein light chain Tctex-type 1 [Trichinella pseudospiralis]
MTFRYKHVFNIMPPTSDKKLTVDAIDQAKINIEEINIIVKQQLENVIGSQPYQRNLVGQWNTAIAENVVNQLSQANKLYKIMGICYFVVNNFMKQNVHSVLLSVNSVLMEKHGSGLHVVSATYWDTNADKSVSVRWESKSVFCHVQIYFCAI